MDPRSRSESRQRLAGAALGAVLAACVCGAVQADNLGRLFTTPQQRAELDELRQASPETRIVEPVLPPEPEQDTKPDVPVAGAMKLKGIVRRSGGDHTAWVNDTNTYEGNLTSQYLRIREEDFQDRQVRITLPDGKSSVRLKVGQTFEPDSGIIKDVVEPYAGEGAVRPVTAPDP